MGKDIYMKMFKRKVTAMFLAVLMATTMAVPAFADTLSPAPQSSSEDTAVSSEPESSAEPSSSPESSTEPYVSPEPSVEPDVAPEPSASPEESPEPSAPVEPSASPEASTEPETSVEPSVSPEPTPLTEAEALQATQRSSNIGNDDIKCDKAGSTYEITGSSRDNRIIVKNGTSSNPVKVILRNVNIDLHRDDYGDSVEESPLSVENGYAIIYIEGSNNLYGGNDHGRFETDGGYAGIYIANDAHVTISGSGNLTVHGGGEKYGAAGIGGNYNDDVSNIVIDGTMTINATGAHSAPGIGSGRDGVCNNITINRGTINATGGKYAPGIGSGDAVGSGDGGTGNGITINGGTVHAYGGENAAGIGGSQGGDMSNITINGGTVEAYGGSGGAGIGGGRDARIDNITITGGDITASGGAYSAGIGGGDSVRTGDGGTCSNIKISGGNIHAYGGESGAGIGGSEGGDMSGITITGGTITASGGPDAAGIGGGRDCRAKDITIHLGSVTAYGGDGGAGIGGGRDGQMTGLVIYDGTINATGGEKGAGIGGGDNFSVGNYGDQDTLKIYGGNITANGGKNAAGIGGGHVREIEGCTIDQKAALTIYAKGGENGAGIGSGDNDMSNISITLTGGTINATGGIYSAGIGGGNGDVGDITIKGKGTINATGGAQGCGIGAGQTGEPESITIEGSSGHSLNITAKATTYSGQEKNKNAAIGSGKATSGNISIKNAELNLRADGFAAEIGGGEYHKFANGTVEKIKINNCYISCTGDDKSAPGIGSGFGGTVDNIIIKNSTYIGGAIGSSAYADHMSAPNCIKTIEIDNSDVTAYASSVPGKPWAGIGSGTWGSVDSIKITNSTIDAKAVGSGAGIGTAGWDSSKTITQYYGGKMGDITIENSNVKSRGGAGGAGIGGGFDTSAGNITIKNSIVDAGTPGSPAKEEQASAAAMPAALVILPYQEAL